MCCLLCRLPRAWCLCWKPRPSVLHGDIRAHTCFRLTAVPLTFLFLCSPPDLSVFSPSALQDTIKVTQVLQLGTLSILPYLAELLMEVGLVRGMRTAIQQIAAGSLSFFVVSALSCVPTTERGPSHAQQRLPHLQDCTFVAANCTKAAQPSPKVPATLHPQ